MVPFEGRVECMSQVRKVNEVNSLIDRSCVEHSDILAPNGEHII